MPAILKGSWLDRALGGDVLAMAYYGLLVAASLVVERHFKRRGIEITRSQVRVDA